MRLLGQASAALGTAALACLLSAVAMAEEEILWHGEANLHDATLSYDIPQSDNASISFSCTRDGDGLTFVYAFVPNTPIDSAEVQVLLQADNITVPIRTTSMHDDDVRSRLFILEGKTVLESRLSDLITSGGTLTVIVKDGARNYPLAGAREAATPLLKTCAGQTPKAGATQATICRMRAWSTDPDPAGQNVRAGPGTEYAVIGRLPPPQEVGGENFATEVSIVGSRDGWFRIEEATINNYIVDFGPNVVFEGEGWVSGRFLALSVEGSHLFMRPSRHAPVALDLNEGSKVPRGANYLGFELERLHACMGNWAEVEVTHIDKRFRGWTDDICSSQVTTCP